MQKSFVYRIVEFSQRHTFSIVFLTVIISIYLGYFTLQIKIDPDVWDILPEQAEPIRLIEEYGENLTPDYLVVAVESEELFSLDKLKALEEAVNRIEMLPQVNGSINPFNLLTFEKKGKRIRLVPMSPGRKAPATVEELESFKKKLLADPLARNLVISKDSTALCSIIHTDYLDADTELISSVEDVLLDLKPYFQTYLAGSTPIVQTTKRYLVKDLPRLLVMAILVILSVFFIGFRSKRSVLLPLVVVALGTIWTTGAMSLLGFRITIVSIMVPPLVLTLGSSYSIHILNQYYREAKIGANNRKWIAASVSHINKTILLAALTTIIGFGSLLSASLRQIREFGIATSLGIIFCTVLSLFFFPAVLSKLRTPTTHEKDRYLKGNIARLMDRISRVVTKWRFFILAVLIAIVVTFVLSLKYIRYQTDYMSYFKKKEKVVHDNLFVVKNFGGFITINITLTAPEGEDKYFLDPQVLRKISHFEDKLIEDSNIAYISSFISYLKLMNLTMTGNFDIPETRPPILLLSRYLKSISSSPMGKPIVGTLLNGDFSRLTIGMRVYDGEKKTLIYEDKLRSLLNRVGKEIQMKLDPETSPVIWGNSLVSLYISDTITKDQTTSVIVSILLIFLVTAISFRSVKFGLFSLIPMLTGIMLNFILMTLLDIPFDVVTVMFASVAIGIGIDDSIHLIIQYRKQAQIFHGDNQRILAHTLIIAGRPILLTSVSLVAGLLVLAISSFMPIVYFGILVSLSLFTTTIGALIILPAMISLWPHIKARSPKVE